MTALLTDEAVQFYDLSVECGLYCQGGRSRFDPTNWPNDYSVVKYPDHLAAIARYESRLAEDAKVRAGLVASLQNLVSAICKVQDWDGTRVGSALDDVDDALAAAKERG